MSLKVGNDNQNHQPNRILKKNSFLVKKLTSYFLRDRIYEFSICQNFTKTFKHSISKNQFCRFTGHHADDLWVGMGIHMPPGGAAGERRKRHRRSRRQRSPKVPASELNKQLNEGDAGDDKRGMAPSQRVQFLLQQQEGNAGDDDDLEPVEPHKVFTEMEELVGTGEKQEWRETARYSSNIFAEKQSCGN